MNISPLWAKLLGAVITAVLATFQIDGNWDEIIKLLVDALVNHPQATGLFGVSAYLAGNALWEANQGLKPWQRQAIEAGAGGFSAKTGEFEWKGAKPDGQ